MIDVLKLFYTTHYNLGALAVLMFLLLIFFLSKKMMKSTETRANDAQNQ